MVSYVKKRDGSIVDFDVTKIENAVEKAFKEVGRNYTQDVLELIAVMAISKVTVSLETINPAYEVEAIQDAIEKVLSDGGYTDVAKAYILYREQHRINRDMKEIANTILTQVEEITKETDHSNANTLLSPASKMAQIAESTNKIYALEKLVPQDAAQAHREGKIYIHDLGFYGITYNCLNFEIHKVLNNMKMPHGYLRRPNHVGTAFALAAIALQSASNSQFGGIGVSDFEIEMAEYITPETTEKELYQACEGFIGNLNTLHARAGNQVSFSSLTLGMGTKPNERRVTKAILEAYDAGLGHHEQPMFPNILFKIKTGVNRNPGDPNYDLFQLALKVTSKRMFPTYINMDSTFNSPYGKEVSYMGCRTRIASNVNGPEVANGRGNISFTTINLPYLALEANKSIDKFFTLLQETLELCEKQLMNRYNILKKLRRKDVPFNMTGLWLNSENRPDDEPIEDSLKNGTNTIGYIGIHNALMALLGKSQSESSEAQELGLRIAKYMFDFANECTKKYHLNFSVIATPAESACYTLLKATRKKFGIIPGVTDRDYLVNSCHIAPWIQVTAEDKIKLEAPYHKYSNAGHILYVELGAAPLGNIEALEKLANDCCDNDAGYFAFNFPIDFCNKCDFLGIIPLEGCPVCGEKEDLRRVRRITGYFSKIENFNKGKQSELVDRVTHMGIPVSLSDILK